MSLMPRTPGSALQPSFPLCSAHWCVISAVCVHVHMHAVCIRVCVHMCACAVCVHVHMCVHMCVVFRVCYVHVCGVWVCVTSGHPSTLTLMKPLLIALFLVAVLPPYSPWSLPQVPPVQLTNIYTWPTRPDGCWEHTGERKDEAVALTEPSLCSVFCCPSVTGEAGACVGRRSGAEAEGGTVSPQ